MCLKEKVKVGNTRSKDKDIKDNQCVDGKTGPVLGLLGFLINCLLPTASKEKGKEGSRGKTVDKTKSPVRPAVFFKNSFQQSWRKW